MNLRSQVGWTHCRHASVPESICFAYRLQHGGQLVAHPIFGFCFCFNSPVRRFDQAQGSGGLGEHCSSSAGRHVLCASLGRVAQPRLLAADRGNPAGAANRGRLLWVTFLGKTRKVTNCRAAPGEVDFRNVGRALPDDCVLRRVEPALQNP